VWLLAPKMVSCMASSRCRWIVRPVAWCRHGGWPIGGRLGWPTSSVDHDHLLLLGGGWEAGVELGMDHRQATTEAGHSGRGLEPAAGDACCTTPALRSGLSRISVIWLSLFCTAHSRPASSSSPSTLDTLTPAILPLAPVAESTVNSWPLAVWPTIRVVASGVAAMPLRLNRPLVSAAGPHSASVRAGPGTP
jgi:hypothetical protein